MPLALAAVALPLLFWDQPPSTADQLRKAGIENIAVSAGQEAAWRKRGLQATAFDPKEAAPATPPKVEYHMDVASATNVPWVDANGWRFERAPSRLYYYDASKGRPALAAAEAFAYSVRAAIRIAPEDVEAFGRMSHFLASIDRQPLPVRANIGVVDDGSEALGEVLNLMARHNLLFHVIPAADPRYDLNIRLGSAEFPAADAADPYAFAMAVRRRLTDEKRLLRIYGSTVVLARLTGEAGRARIHLLNYGERPVPGLRVRVLGTYASGQLSAFGRPDAALQDYTAADGATEFSIPELGPYAVVDLK